MFQFLPDQVNRLSLEELSVHTDVFGGWAVTRYDLRFGPPQAIPGGARGEFLFSLAPDEELLSAHIQTEKTIQFGDSSRIKRKSVYGRRSNGDLGEAHDFANLRFHSGWLAPSGHRMVRLGEISIPENGIRVRIAIKHHFVYNSGDLKGIIPLRFDQKADTFKLEGRVHDVDYVPITTHNPNLKVRFRSYKGDYRARVRKANYRANESVELLLPAEYNEAKVWYGKRDTTTDFLVHIATEKEGGRRRKPKKIALWWDTGPLTEMYDREKELEVLASYFRSLRNVEVEVVRFGFVGGEFQSFTIENGEWSGVEAYLRGESFSRPFEAMNWEERIFEREEVIICTHKPSASFLPFLKRVNLEQVPATYILNSAPQRLQISKVSRFKTSPIKVIDLYGQDRRVVQRQLTQAIYQVREVKANERRIKSLNLEIGQNFPGILNFTGTVRGKGTPIEVRMGTPDKNGERFRMRLRPFDMVKIKSALVDLISRGPSEQMVFPQTPDEYIRFGLKTPPSWRLWARSLTALKERNDRIDRESITDQIGLRRDRLADAWADMQEWYDGQFDPSDILATPTSLEPLNLRKPGPSLALRVYDLPRLFAGPDSTFGLELPIEAYEDAQTVKLLQASLFRSIFGNLAEEGIWFVSSKPNDTSADSLDILPERADAPPYLRGLDRLSDADLIYRFLDLQYEYAGNPSFYLDFADQMILRGMVHPAAKTLQFLPELGLNAPEVLRAAGHRLLSWEQPHTASAVFAEVVRLHPDDPLAHRDLGLSLLAFRQRNAALKELITALKVDFRLFESRYPGVNEIILRELNHEGNAVSDNGVGTFEGITEPMALDLRVTLEWTRSDTDVDLWVTDPDGVICNYDRPVTPMGGKLSGDVTNGFGPEEFVLKQAKDGVYTIEVEYEDDPERRISGANFVKVTIFSNYGRESEQVTVVPLRLERKAAKVVVARIRIG